MVSGRWGTEVRKVSGIVMVAILGCGGARKLRSAASVLGVRPAILRREIRRGRLRGVRLGRLWWVADAEAERWSRQRV